MTSAQAMGDCTAATQQKRIASVTCSLAMVVDGNSKHGELKVCVQNNGGSKAPLHELALDEIKQLIDAGHVLVSTCPNNRYTFFSAKLLPHWAVSVEGSDVLRNILFTTAVAYETLFHFIRLRGGQALFLDLQLKNALMARGLLPDRRKIVYSESEVAAIGDRWFELVGVHIWVFVAVAILAKNDPECSIQDAVAAYMTSPTNGLRNHWTPPPIDPLATRNRRLLPRIRDLAVRAVSPQAALWVKVVWSLTSPLFSGEFLRILLDRYVHVFEYDLHSKMLRDRGEEILCLSIKDDLTTDYGTICEVMRSSRYQVSAPTLPTHSSAGRCGSGVGWWRDVCEASPYVCDPPGRSYLEYKRKAAFGQLPCPSQSGESFACRSLS